MLEIKEAQGEARNIKFRSFGETEDSAAGVDVSIKLTCDAGENIPTLTGSGLSQNFWRKGEDKELTYPFLGWMESQSKVNYCQVTLADVQLKNCTASKIKFLCMPGGYIEIAMNVSAPDISDKEIANLRYLLKQPLTISIDGGDLVDAINTLGGADD